MTELVDTVARAASAILDLSETVRRVDVEFEDEQTPQTVTAFRCGGCETTHVKVHQTRDWDREAADRELFKQPDV
jgi:hypothetical protein